MVRTFQHTAIFRKLTVLEDVMIGTHLKTSHGLGSALLGRRIYRDEEREARKRALEILEFLGMADRATLAAENLPYGEQRNLEIAMALAAGPELLLLDEPAAGLNPEESVDLMRVIRSVRDTGITIMLVEHDMKVVMGICDRIVVLDHGVQIAEGSPQEIRENPEVIRVYLGRRKGSA
jgi:ABC-type branched-subunit amino acid transport system ATPase component